MCLADPCPAILSVGIAVPPYQIVQSAICTWVSDSLEASPAQRRWLNALYTRSGIETRHSCLPDGAALIPHSRFAPGLDLAIAQRLTYVPPVATRPLALRQPQLVEEPLYVA